MQQTSGSIEDFNRTVGAAGTASQEFGEAVKSAVINMGAMNIQLRKTEDSPYIFTLYPLEEYKVTREESIKRTQTTKIQTLLTDPLSYFSNLSSLEASVEETPLKIWDGFKRCE